tara:strand:- start:1207 stop:1434 length:228 start_codon:yes stop_codon:yes gene_type:complete
MDRTLIDLKKWLAVKDHRVEMVKSYVSGKTIAEISIEFNRPVYVVRANMSDYMPNQDNIDSFKRRFAANKLKNKR